MGVSMDREPGNWAGNLDGSNQTPVIAIMGKAIGGMTSSVAQAYEVLVGFDPASMVPLSVDGAASTIDAPADQGVLVPPEAFAFHYLQLRSVAGAAVAIGTKS